MTPRGADPRGTRLPTVEVPTFSRTSFQLPFETQVSRNTLQTLKPIHRA